MAIIGGLIFILIYANNQFGTASTDVSMADLAGLIKQGKVDNITVSGDQLEVKLLEGKVVSSRKEPGTSLYETFTLLGVDKDQLGKTNISVAGPNVLLAIGNAFLYFILPIAL